VAAYGLETAVYGAKTDPLGEKDIFLTLPPGIKRRLSNPVNFDTDEKLRTLGSLESTTLIHVKLVGFSSEHHRLSVLESELGAYLASLTQDLHASVIGHAQHKLIPKTKITVEVGRVQENLAEKIHAAIDQHIENILSAKVSKTYPGQLHQVPYEIIDRIVQTVLEDPLPTYTVYLLNLKPQTHGKYAYIYSESAKAAYLTKCLGSLWTGKERYMWIDLAAGPVEYGPATSGEGYVKGEMLPIASTYSSSQQTTLAADLASLVWSAARMLFVPAVRIPVSFWTDLEVHFIHIKAGSKDDAADPKGLDFEALEALFLEKNKDGLLFSHQNLKFQHAIVSLADCPLCSAALSRAMRTYTARILLEKYSLFLDYYLDSKTLHHFLSDFGNELAEHAGIKHPGATTRVIPVYVWDLDSERQLLLDRFHQVMPFRDMVIAVRTAMKQAVIEYSCNGRQLLVPTRELERPIIGGLLQTLFGIAPTHLTWSYQHNSTMVDYRWGVGRTPFGPFSDLQDLSFAQRDAARRNTILTMLNYTMGSAADLLHAIKAYGGEKKLLGPKNHLEFSQRWNLLIFKLSKVMSALSHFEFDTALYYLKSMEHDLFAVHTFIYTATTEMEATMSCFKSAPFPWAVVSAVLGTVAVAIYVWIKREKLFVNKKKRF